MQEQFTEVVLSRPLTIESEALTPVPLVAQDSHPHWFELRDGQVKFVSAGWFEILLTVQWDTANRTGERFSHTSIPDHHPLHSEAISARVLADISDGKQLLRGNSVFGPDGADSLRLQVWQNSGEPVQVTGASLGIRPLKPPEDDPGR